MVKKQLKLNLINKIKYKIWKKTVNSLKNYKLYPIIYKSFWHYVIYKSKNTNSYKNNYYTALPNSVAGIGHQMANWIAGYWFAQNFDLRHVHSSFSDTKWEQFFGFGEEEISVEELKKKGYRVIRLPLFDEKRKNEVELQKKIIESYNSRKLIFEAEIDQFYEKQFGVIDHIQKKFYNAEHRNNENLIFNKNVFNIAIHIRRGDIVQGKIENNPNLTMRWLSNNYFETLLQSVLDYLKTNKEVHIYLFSQGKESDFASFKHFSNLHFCLDMNAQDSFLHMVMADVLITSKSSFSYKPSLLNKGIKVVPKDFWHGYPKTKDFILADNAGNLLLNEQK